MQLFTNSTEKTCFNSHLQAPRWSSCWHSALSNFRLLYSNYAIMDKSDSSCVLPDSLQLLLQITGRNFHQFYTSDDKPQKFLSYFEKQTPQYKINCRKSVPQNFDFHRLQCQYQSGQS